MSIIIEYLNFPNNTFIPPKNEILTSSPQFHINSINYDDHDFGSEEEFDYKEISINTEWRTKAVTKWMLLYRSITSLSEKEFLMLIVLNHLSYGNQHFNCSYRTIANHFLNRNVLEELNSEQDENKRKSKRNEKIRPVVQRLQLHQKQYPNCNILSVKTSKIKNKSSEWNLQCLQLFQKDLDSVPKGANGNIKWKDVEETFRKNIEARTILSPNKKQFDTIPLTTTSKSAPTKEESFIGENQVNTIARKAAALTNAVKTYQMQTEVTNDEKEHYIYQQFKQFLLNNQFIIDRFLKDYDHYDNNNQHLTGNDRSNPLNNKENPLSSLKKTEENCLSTLAGAKDTDLNSGVNWGGLESTPISKERERNCLNCNGSLEPYELVGMLCNRCLDYASNCLEVNDYYDPNEKERKLTELTDEVSLFFSILGTVGVKSADFNVLNLSKNNDRGINDREKAVFSRKNIDLKFIAEKLQTNYLSSNLEYKHHLFVRPKSNEIEIFAIDDIKDKNLLKNEALFCLNTSPGNYLIGLAVKCSKTEQPRIMKALKAKYSCDKGANGSFRIGYNLKPKYFPHNPLVMVESYNEGKILTLNDLENLGINFSESKQVFSNSSFSNASMASKLSPSFFSSSRFDVRKYYKYIQDNTFYYKTDGTPDNSILDLMLCTKLLKAGWDEELILSALCEVSEKAKSRIDYRMNRISRAKEYLADKVSVLNGVVNG